MNDSQSVGQKGGDMLELSQFSTDNYQLKKLIQDQKNGPKKVDLKSLKFTNLALFLHAAFFKTG